MRRGRATRPRNKAGPAAFERTADQSAYFESSMSLASQLAGPLAEARNDIARLQAAARARGLELPTPPEEPHPATCCGRGCFPCMYTYYFEAMEKWRVEAGKHLAGA